MEKQTPIETVTKGNLFVSPVEFFCGDTVFLSYDFLVSDFAAMELKDLNNIEFSSQAEIGNIINFNPDIYDIKSISFETNQNQITVKINCIFWQPGNIQLPTFKIAEENQVLEFIIPEIKVSSMIEKSKITVSQTYAGPAVIPGSKYLVYGGFLLIIAFISGIVFFLIKMKKIKRFFKELKTKYKFKKNYKKSVLAIKNLLKNSNSYTSKEYCLQIQSILRNYFAYRFSPEIFNLTTSEIMQWFNTIFYKILPENAETAVQLFYEIMFRCDFIRFSGKSVPEGKMQTNERETLAQKSLQTFCLIEKGILTENDKI
ncbi:MAG: hypothetical protein ACTTHG_03230 [Treponemataceae bacterium]